MEIIFSSNGTVQSQYKMPLAQARQIEKIIKETLTEPMEKPKKVTKAKKTTDSRLLDSIRAGLQDVKEMREGKQPKVTLNEFLNEL
jgi:hypothetical protein